MTPKDIQDQKLMAIFEALITALKTQKMADISVSALCRAAGVSRTYYYHKFKSYEDIIEQASLLNIVNYMRHLPHQENLDSATFIGNYFQLAQNMRSVQLTIFQVGQERSLILAFQTAFNYLLTHDFIDAPQNDRIHQKYFSEFIAGAAINMSQRWLTEGMPESPAHMGQLVAQFMNARDVKR